MTFENNASNMTFSPWIVSSSPLISVSLLTLTGSKQLTTFNIIKVITKEYTEVKTTLEN